MTARTSRGGAARQAAVAGALALGGALALAAGAGPAEAQTVIRGCPFTIMQPGTYALATDLTCPPPAITITADNVRLLLSTRTVTSASPNSGDGVRAAAVAGNPTIDGLSIVGPGTLNDFLNGIRINDAPGLSIAGVTVTGNADDGIETDDTPGAQLTGNTATGNRFGYYLQDCLGCQFLNNRATNTTLDGFLGSVTNRSRFAGNTATGSGDDGIDLNGCDGCEVFGNRAEGSGDAGFEIFQFITGARIFGNTATNNRGEGIDLTTSTVDNNLVQANTTTGNGTSGRDTAGIRVGADATGNRLEGNLATGNIPVDLRDNNPVASPCANAWTNNQFATDSEGNGPGAGCIR